MRMPTGLPRVRVRTDRTRSDPHAPAYATPCRRDRAESARRSGEAASRRAGRRSEAQRERSTPRRSEATARKRTPTSSCSAARPQPHQEDGSQTSGPLVIISVIAVGAIVSGVLLEQVVLAQSAFKLDAINERLAAAEEHARRASGRDGRTGEPRSDRAVRPRRTSGWSTPTAVEYIVADVRIARRQPARRCSRVG